LAFCTLADGSPEFHDVPAVMLSKYTIPRGGGIVTKRPQARLGARLDGSEFEPGLSRTGNGDPHQQRQLARPSVINSLAGQ
jgi:hypothetical protein